MEEMPITTERGYNSYEVKSSSCFLFRIEGTTCSTHSSYKATVGLISNFSEVKLNDQKKNLKIKINAGLLQVSFSSIINEFLLRNDKRTSQWFPTPCVISSEIFGNCPRWTEMMARLNSPWKWVTGLLFLPFFFFFFDQRFLYLV